MNDTIYQRELMEHYRNPKHRGKIPDATHQHSNDNPSCGDQITINLKVIDNIITDMKFIGTGCIISQAAASILADNIINQPVETLKNMTANQLLKLLKIQLGPNRTRCATLALSATKEAISDKN